MSVITFESVSKSYKGHTLYQDVSFEIVEGSATAFSGPNGSGKSVLFKMICGFTQPDSGLISVDPKFLSHRRNFPENFGIIIDRPAYLAGQSGLRNLSELAGIRKIIDESQVRESMRLVGLNPDLKVPVRKYSLGMKQKLALAQALMENPRVLVLDEPFNGLDADSAVSIRRILKDRIDDGVTVIFTSHNRGDIQELASQQFEIQNGGVIELPVKG